MPDTVDVSAANEKWEARLLRVTAFAHRSRKPNQELWQDVVGTTPSELAIKPLMRSTGPVKGGVLSITDQGSRIDFLLSANVPPTSETIFECIAELGEALDFFRPLITTWLQVKPELHRLAFGAILFKRVSDRLSGYRTLARHLPDLHVPVDDNVTDFLYQINRRRKSTTVDCDEILINRLNKWSVVTGVAFFFSDVAPGSAQEADSSLSQDAVVLEIDVNTWKEYTGIIPHLRLCELYDELVRLAIEIAEHGDIP